MATGLTFVSYARTDSDFAVKLASDLRAQGADVWLDQLDIEPGLRWDTAVEGALGRSARLLVLLTPKSVASQNVLDEVSYALEEGKTVLPVLVEACAIPMRMRRLQYVDFTRGYDAGVARLLTTLGAAQPSASAAAAPPAPDTPPPARPAPALESAAAIEHEPAAQAEPDVLRSPAANHSRGVPIVPIGAGIVLLVAAVVWFSFSPSTVTTSQTPSEAIANGPAATPSDSPAAAQPAPPAPAGTSVEAPVGALGAGATTTASSATSEPGLQALLALTRQFGARSALAEEDLDRLATAQESACRNLPPSSPCASAASNALDYMLSMVCSQQQGPAPSDRAEVTWYDANISACRQAYMNVLLRLKELKSKDGIRHIRG